MPGILPMKVINVGSNSQARIAQACDRCRSKKIRCDGIRPCCSQCSNVGFECKTSDKLSRRAFPRGYTESLEERVRSLEAEVRDLKDLLDEKDEKIELLSRLHSNRRPVPTPKTLAPPVPELAEISKEAVPTQLQDDTFRVEATPLLLDTDNRDSHFRGVSSGKSFLETFKRKIQESGKSIAGFDIDTLISTQAKTLPKFQGKTSDESSIPSAPPRIFADRCVNVYFQEWAPLFPVLHKPTFLQIYEEYMSDPEELLDHHKLAQLHLVLGIAGLSSNIVDRVQIAQCERRWRSSLQTVLIESNLATLQCLVLALIYCISKADYKYLKYYKETATGLSRHLLLHESQKRFAFGALTIETRKKVFWTLYAVDCFSAAFLGLPKLLNEYDVHTEYPRDIDDEHVTEEGFEPTLPGEVTKISSALSLFRASRILSKVLEKNYPVESSHELSLQSLGALEAELNQWSNSLPQHLKLTFIQDKPSTDITGSRSVILSLAYYYIRILIHRPAVGSSLGTRASPSIISLADSSKHIIQIVQLLEERNMSFSFCLNKHEMLKLCGLSLLYQGLDLKREGKLMQDIQRLVAIVQQYLGKENTPGVASFTRVASLVTSAAASSRASPAPYSDLAAPVSTDLNISLTLGKLPTQSQFGLMASAKTSEDDILAQHEKFRRATLSNLSLQQHEHRSRGRNYIDSTRSLSPNSKLGHQNSGAHIQKRLKGRHPNSEKALQLDYLSLINPKNLSKTESLNHIHPYQVHIPQQQQSQSLKQPPKQVPNSHSFVDTTSPYHNTIKPIPNGLLEWEMLLGSLDGGQGNMYDAIYGGLNSTLVRADNSSSSYGDCTPNSPKWDLASLGMNDSGACSVLSFSEESLSLPDELSISEVPLRGEYEVTYLDVQGAGTDGEGYLLEGLDSRLGY